MPDDYAASTATTGTVSVGGSTTGNIETSGDTDWFRITLTAGETYDFRLNSATSGGLDDPYLSLYDSSGTLLNSNDDGGGNLNSLLLFTASTSGTYYLGARAYSSGTGLYTVSATVSAKTFATVPELADFLVSGYWGGASHHWASSTITVNITDLTSAEQDLARSALNAYHEVSDISFIFTSGSANITFNNNGSGKAFTNSNWDGSGNMTSATIDISSNWWPSDDIYSYMYQTYLHETGHALGLGHQGPYNGSATYGTDNLFTNDTWQWSVMSYFPQSNFGGASYDFVTTPEMADIQAVQTLYGAASTRTGDNTYGFHNNAGSIYDLTQYTGTPAFTIYDTGGTDTVDFSGYSVSQTINLNPGAWSSIGGYVNNIGIYLTTNIEIAIGGSGNDRIVGNSGDNNLSGGLGNDVIDGGLGVDRAVFAGMRSDYTLTRSGLTTTVSGPDATDTLTGIEFLVFNDTTLSTPAAPNDFNGDGTSELLWHANATGDTGYWTTDSSGNVTGFHDFGAGSTAYAVAGVGDFDGDGISDVLWHDSTNGDTGYWTTDGNGNVTGFHDFGAGNTTYAVAGVGDFDGNGRDDVLWHNSANGDTGYWTTDSSGNVTGFHDFGAGSTTYAVAGVGDFDGNGKDDLLWYNSANGDTGYWTTDSGGTVTGFHDFGAGSTAYSVAGVGDFNGDGRSDVLWHDSVNGDTGYWKTDSSGTVFGFDDLGAGNTAYTVAGVGDFNGDGRSDVLWHNSSTGDTGYWVTNSSGVVTGFHDYGAGSTAYGIV